MVLNGPIPAVVEAAMEQSYAMKGSKEVTVMVVCEPRRVLCMVTPLPVSVMVRVYCVIIPLRSCSLGGLQLKVMELGDSILPMNI